MPKIKQVTSKRPRTGQIGFEPPKRAIKSTLPANTSHNASPRRLPAIPTKISRIIATARRSDAKPARKSIPPVRRENLLQKTRFATYSIPKRTFQRLCRDISHRYLPECRFTLEALVALQTAMEDFMVGFFEDAAMCMRHANRKTLFLKDIELVAKLRRFEYETL